MSKIELVRPLVVLDLETTGTDPATDRIVEIAAMRLEPDGRRLLRCRRLNPRRPIPAEATAVHGIRDEDVRDAPTFRQIARSLLEFLEGADLAGFNIRRFDLPILEREFRDCGMDLGLAGRRVIDAMTIFHRMEPRDLGAAVRFYLGREHDGAHGAEADVEAAWQVLQAQVERYPELPRRSDALGEWCAPPRASEATVDREGKFVRREGRIVFAFGKYQGRPLDEVAREEPEYLEWILRSDFPEDARDLVARALGRVPGEAAPAPGQST